jgi:hypothetical protein
LSRIHRPILTPDTRLRGRSRFGAAKARHLKPNKGKLIDYAHFMKKTLEQAGKAPPAIFPTKLTTPK